MAKDLTKLSSAELTALTDKQIQGFWANRHGALNKLNATSPTAGTPEHDRLQKINDEITILSAQRAARGLGASSIPIAPAATAPTSAFPSITKVSQAKKEIKAEKIVQADAKTELDVAQANLEKVDNLQAHQTKIFDKVQELDEGTQQLTRLKEIKGRNGFWGKTLRLVTFGQYGKTQRANDIAFLAKLPDAEMSNLPSAIKNRQVSLNSKSKELEKLDAEKVKQVAIISALGITGPFETATDIAAVQQTAQTRFDTAQTAYDTSTTRIADLEAHRDGLPASNLKRAGIVAGLAAVATGIAGYFYNTSMGGPPNLSQAGGALSQIPDALQHAWTGITMMGQDALAYVNSLMQGSTTQTATNTIPDGYIDPSLAQAAADAQVAEEQAAHALADGALIDQANQYAADTAQAATVVADTGPTTNPHPDIVAQAATVVADTGPTNNPHPDVVAQAIAKAPYIDSTAPVISTSNYTGPDLTNVTNASFADTAMDTTAPIAPVIPAAATAVSVDTSTAINTELLQTSLEKLLDKDGSNDIDALESFIGAVGVGNLDVDTINSIKQEISASANPDFIGTATSVAAAEYLAANPRDYSGAFDIISKGVIENVPGQIDDTHAPKSRIEAARQIVRSLDV